MRGIGQPRQSGAVRVHDIDVGAAAVACLENDLGAGWSAIGRLSAATGQEYQQETSGQCFGVGHGQLYLLPVKKSSSGSCRHVICHAPGHRTDSSAYPQVPPEIHAHSGTLTAAACSLTLHKEQLH